MLNETGVHPRLEMMLGRLCSSEGGSAYNMLNEESEYKLMFVHTLVWEWNTPKCEKWFTKCCKKWVTPLFYIPDILYFDTKEKWF
jgi:hypothetical protein